MARPGITYPVYQQPSRVTFGTGSVKTLADENLDAAIVFLSGQAPVRSAVDAALARRGARLDDSRVLVKPAGEPTIEMIRTGAEFLSRHQASHVVAVGGGSVLDWARLSWAAAEGLLSLDTARMAMPERARRPQFVLVPTTCATGAEAAGVAVYSDGERKRAVVSRAFVADDVILDAQFVRTMNDAALACSLADTLSHAIEAYVSLVPGTLAKEAAASALRLVLEHAATTPGSCRDERLMEAAYLGGVAASNCSVGVVHAFAHALAAFGIGHGRANALGLHAGLTVNADVPALAALVRQVGASDLIDLRARVRQVIAPALDGPAASQVCALLQDARSRTEIVERMATDVCLRSNPRTMSGADLFAFLQIVEETLTQSCRVAS